MPYDNTIPKPFAIDSKDSEKGYRDPSYMPQWLRTDEYKDAHLPLASAADSKSLPPTVLTTAQSSTVRVPNGWLIQHGFEDEKQIKSPIGADIELQEMESFRRKHRLQASHDHPILIKYDFSTITMLFRQVQYSEDKTSITSFTEHEKVILRQTIHKIIEYSYILIALLAGYKNPKYRRVNGYIDRQEIQVRPWLKSALHQLNTIITDPSDIITFVDCRRDKIIKLAAQNQSLSPRQMMFSAAHEEIHIRQEQAIIKNWGSTRKLVSDRTSVSRFYPPPLGIPLRVTSYAIANTTTFQNRANGLLQGLIKDVIGENSKADALIDIFYMAIDIGEGAYTAADNYGNPRQPPRSPKFDAKQPAFLKALPKRKK